jgi:hypothetical protein
VAAENWMNSWEKDGGSPSWASDLGRKCLSLLSQKWEETHCKESREHSNSQWKITHPSTENRTKEGCGRGNYRVHVLGSCLVSGIFLPAFNSQSRALPLHPSLTQ